MPVVLVTGDRAVCIEGTRAARRRASTTVEVKQGLGRFSARMKTPQEARELIEAGAKKALSDLAAVAPYDPGRPCEIAIEFTTPDRLQEYREPQGRRGDRRVLARRPRRRLVDGLVGLLLLAHGPVARMIAGHSTARSERSVQAAIGRPRSWFAVGIAIEPRRL